MVFEVRPPAEAVSRTRPGQAQSVGEDKSGFANPFRAERLGNFMPFLWYGIRFREWREMLAEGHYRITLNRLPNVLGVTLLTALSAVFSRLSDLIYARRAASIAIVPPVFVLGHWRSGTSFLHNLFCCDPRLAYPTTYQCSFPSGFLVTEKVLGWMVAPFLPARRPMDDLPVGRDAPFEDEFALAKLGAGSPYMNLAFPREGPRHTRFLDFVGTTQAEKARWREVFLWFMRRLQIAYPGRRLILKSPPHTARIAILLKLFPEARFVHISRNPFEVYASTYRMWKIVNSRVALQNPPQDEPWLGEYVLSALSRMYDAYQRDLAAVPPGRLVEIRYEDLVENPVQVLGEVYRGLGLGDFAVAKKAIEAYLSGLGPHKARSYRITRAEREAILDRWSFYFERFGYDKGGPGDPEPRRREALAES